MIEHIKPHAIQLYYIDQWSYVVEIIITFCVNLLRFALSFYVLGNVTFCGPTTSKTPSLQVHNGKRGVLSA